MKKIIVTFLFILSLTACTGTSSVDNQAAIDKLTQELDSISRATAEMFCLESKYNGFENLTDEEYEQAVGEQDAILLKYAYPSFDEFTRQKDLNESYIQSDVARYVVEFCNLDPELIYEE